MTMRGAERNPNVVRMSDPCTIVIFGATGDLPAANSSLPSTTCAVKACCMPTRRFSALHGVTGVTTTSAPCCLTRGANTRVQACPTCCGRSSRNASTMCVRPSRIPLAMRHWHSAWTKSTPSMVRVAIASFIWPPHPNHTKTSSSNSVRPD